MTEEQLHERQDNQPKFQAVPRWELTQAVKTGVEEALESFTLKVIKAIASAYGYKLVQTRVETKIGDSLIRVINIPDEE